jgi:hypothetical protein
MAQLAINIFQNKIKRYYVLTTSLPASAAARLLKIVGSNPVGGMDVLSVVSVVCCQVEVSAAGRSLVQRSPTESVCVLLREIRCNYKPHSYNGYVEEVRLRKKEKEKRTITKYKKLVFNCLVYSVFSELIIQNLDRGCWGFL